METIWARPENSTGKYHAMAEEGEVFTRVCTGVPEAGDLAQAPDELDDGERCGNCRKKMDGPAAKPEKPRQAANELVMASFVMGGPVFLHGIGRVTKRHDDGSVDIEVPPMQGRPRIFLEACPRCDLAHDDPDLMYPSWKPLPEEPAEEE